MVNFNRNIRQKIEEKLFKENIIVILGPRQSGKTTLSKSIIEQYKDIGVYYSCEISEVRNVLVLGDPDKLRNFIGDKKLIVLDEAQTVQDIGKILKIFFDKYKDVQIIATGSSSFDLSNKIKEPMTGRAFEFFLPPLSYDEILESLPNFKLNINDLLLYGSYPAIVGASDAEAKKEELKKIATNYLYKDVYIFESIRNPKVFEDLLIMLAYSLGNTISTSKMAKDLGISSQTVEKYLRLLEQSFVIKRIYSFSRNYANELKKSYKVYFLDCGIRNAIIPNFDLNEKNKGVLFENFFIMEMMKKGYLEIFLPRYTFWRTKQGLEIDLIVESELGLFAYECKINDKITVNFNTFIKYYKDAKVQTINLTNFTEILIK